MTQNGSLTRGQDRRHPATASRDPANTDDIDAAMDLVQLTSLQAADYGLPPHSKREQLLSANHPVLPSPKLGNRPIKRTSAELSTSAVPNSARRSHCRNGEGIGPACGAQIVPILRLKA
jgi:hypothetical protein